MTLSVVLHLSSEYQEHMGYFDKKNKLKIIYVILTGKERRINGFN